MFSSGNWSTAFSNTTTFPKMCLLFLAWTFNVKNIFITVWINCLMQK
jgi:hypothetical protein